MISQDSLKSHLKYLCIDIFLRGESPAVTAAALTIVRTNLNSGKPPL